MKKRYLTRIFPKYCQKFQELRKSKDFTQSEKIFENSIRLYRNQMLYDQSKEISAIFIKLIKSEVLSILGKEGSLSSINKAEMFIDNKLIETQYVWLNANESKDILFSDLKLNILGKYSIRVGACKETIIVKSKLSSLN